MYLTKNSSHINSIMEGPTYQPFNITDQKRMVCHRDIYTYNTYNNIKTESICYRVKNDVDGYNIIY